MFDTRTFSRIDKLQVDLREADPAESARRRRGHRLVLLGGPELATSATLQAALLTAAVTAARCFPGGVTYAPPQPTFNPPLRVGHERTTLNEAVADAGVNVDAADSASDVADRLVFGTRHAADGALQVTFDGWAGGVVPVEDRFHLAENEGCPLAGVAAGALGVSEFFLRFAGVAADAGYRTAGLSLWRPDLEWTDADAVGPAVRYLPEEFWLLGLGHLGQAYLWSIGLLPFSRPAKVRMLLNDHDEVEPANYETGVLTSVGDAGRTKARVAADWLEARGFRPRIVERPFDAGVTRCAWEPRLALCGFDGSGPRWAIGRPGFTGVVSAGLGGTAYDFDRVDMHFFPHPTITPETEWPQAEQRKDKDRAKHLADSNKVYRDYREAAGCGHLELAGRAVAVPFVGAVAAALAVSESLRMLHGGPRVGTMRLSLGAMQHRIVRLVEGGYGGRATPVFGFQVTADGASSRDGRVGDQPIATAADNSMEM